MAGTDDIAAMAKAQVTTGMCDRIFLFCRKIIKIVQFFVWIFLKTPNKFVKSNFHNIFHKDQNQFYIYKKLVKSNTRQILRKNL